MNGSTKEYVLTPSVGAGQSLAIGATSAATATGVTASVVELTATVACWVSFGSAPTAAVVTSYPMLTPNLPYRFSFTPGNKIAVIQASAAGTLYINPMV